MCPPITLHLFEINYEGPASFYEDEGGILSCCDITFCGSLLFPSSPEC